MTVDKVALGKQLFFDTRLSKDGKMFVRDLPSSDKG